MDGDMSQSSLLDGTDFVARLDSVEKRLDQHASAETPTGLTDPDPGGTERWEAGQVWSHIAEFVGYWQSQVEMSLPAARLECTLATPHSLDRRGSLASRSGRACCVAVGFGALSA